MTRPHYPSDLQDKAMVRFPPGMKDWLKERAVKNNRSMSGEIIFLLRERMQAATGEGFADTAPAAVTRTGALQGSNSTNGL